jgi:hypothetical protein
VGSNRLQSGFTEQQNRIVKQLKRLAPDCVKLGYLNVSGNLFVGALISRPKWKDLDGTSGHLS